MKKLFGTDGIRGIANEYPMTPTMAINIGIAIAQYVKKEGYSSVIIGRDTRLSGYMLESALAAGITSVGVNVLTTGIIPTPAVAFLSSDRYTANAKRKNAGSDDIQSLITQEVGAGIVISASHNPWLDNGIKIFKRGGWKLSDEEEKNIESMIFSIETDSNNLKKTNTTGKSEIKSSEIKSSEIKNSETGRIYPINDAKQRYVEFLKRGFNPKKCNLKLVVDCSNGASSDVAPMLFDHSFLLAPLVTSTLANNNERTMGHFNANFIFNQPDGKNINENCGSQHTETLSRQVVESHADIGLAFDGDADRLIAIDETGVVITGDRILAICAAHAKRKGTLENNCVVSTVMSNIGLSRTLESLGIKHFITGVGDREVLQKMIESGAVMGGEDSGHMIFSQYHTTGDGLLTALRLIEVMVDTERSLSELASIMKVYPQILMNVEVDNAKPDFMAVKSIADEIKSVEAALGADGRVLVRYSGTQPLLRVMVEGPEYNRIKHYCERICNQISNKIRYV